MGKVRLGPQMLPYPRPTFLVGTEVDGKPNFMMVAAGGTANVEPPMISVAIRRNRYTNKCIRQNMVFSVNVPSTDLVREADYCGLVSGSEVNKAEVCQFSVFYGKLKNAPLIEQCPVNLECKVVHILDLGSHSLFVGRIEEIHVSESCLTGGEPDINKIKPFIYTGDPNRQYRAFGRVLAKGYSVGQALKATGPRPN